MTEHRYDERSDRRVFTGAMQLLGHMSHRDAMSLPRDRLPVPVASRLALVVAELRNPGQVLCLRKPTPEAKAARDKALRTAVKTVRRWTAADASALLLGPVSLPVVCGRGRHVVTLEPDGSVVLEAHPDVDIALERVSAALGAEVLPCVRAHPDAQTMWSPPVADDGFRIEPVCAGELLAFVVLVRQWLDASYDLWSAAPALLLGVEPHEVASHLALGLELDDALAWRFCPATEIPRWQAYGFRAEDARTWLQQGRTLASLEKASVTVREGRWLARWAAVVGPGISTEVVIEWARFREPVGVWGEAAQRGLRASDVIPWVESGFESVGILRYAHLRVPLAVACQWREQGFSAYEACGYLGVRMTLVDALALRDLPARAVQELWPHLRAAEAVREALARV